MRDSEPPQRRPAAAETDLLRRAAELQSLTPRLVTEAREQVRWSRELRQVAESLCDSDDRPAPGRDRGRRLFD
jgi:hypothetical protein